MRARPPQLSRSRCRSRSCSTSCWTVRIARCGGFDRKAQITVFLQRELDDTQAASVAPDLRKWEAVQEVQVVTRAEALAEYQ